MKRSLLALAFAAVTLVGCGGGGYYYATSEPPPLRAEYVGVAPGPGYVWINGYWGWRGNNYYWVPGRYERPPHRGSYWVAPHWERHGNHYVMRQGHWR